MRQGVFRVAARSNSTVISFQTFCLQYIAWRGTTATDRNLQVLLCVPEEPYNPIFAIDAARSAVVG